MSMHKAGVEMLRRAVLLSRSSSLWQQYGSLIRTNSALHYKSRWGIISAQGHVSERVRYYCQDRDPNLQVTPSADLQSTATKVPKLPNAEISELSDKTERVVPFYTHLENCFSPTDVLDTLKQFTVSQQNISSVLTRMWESTKRLTEEQRRYELRLMFEHPGFEELCDRATTDSWRMRSDDLAYSLLAVIKLGVPQNTRVVQTLLRVIQERLNQFDERSLSVLAGCFRDMENSKNVQALREALRLLLNDRVSEIQSVVVLQSMMRGVGKDSPTHLKKKMATKALSMIDEFSPPNTQYMFSSLAAMGLNFKPLLDVCSNKIAENVHEFPFTRLLAVLKSCHELHYRNYTLFTSISEYVTNTFDMWSNKQVILFLVTFEDLAFRPVALLDAFAERIIQKSGTLTLKDLLSVLKVYSLLNHDLKDYRQEFLSSVSKILESYLPKISLIDLLKAVHYLGLLEHFPQPPLEKLLQPDSLDQLLQKGRQSDKVQRWLQTLGLCLQLEKTLLPPTLTSIPDFRVTVRPRELTTNQDVLSSVKSIVGNDAVQDSVLEQNVYFIDYVITLSNQTEDNSGPHAEDALSPECTQRIAMVCAPPSSFCFGTTHPRSSLAVKLRHLEKLGYKPVLVPVHELNSQTQEERIKMLRNLIFPMKEPSETQKKQTV